MNVPSRSQGANSMVICQQLWIKEGSSLFSIVITNSVSEEDRAANRLFRALSDQWGGAHSGHQRFWGEFSSAGDLVDALFETLGEVVRL